MRKLFPVVLFVLSFYNCKKPDEPIIPTIKIAVINPYWDSLYVTVTNNTTPQFSSQRKLAGKTANGKENYFEIDAKENDKIVLKSILKPGKSLGRHPLFVTEYSYETLIIAPYRGTPHFNYAPSTELLTISVTNKSNKFVKGNLIYDGKEDSLFAIGPQELSERPQGVGYFKTSEIKHITKPFVKYIFGQMPPYTISMSSAPLWEDITKANGLISVE